MPADDDPGGRAVRSEGTFCLVLHSHLPWLPRHGAWPVGEDWLYQAWADSYLPVVDVLHRLAARGRRDVLTLGVTPVLAAQLDHPYALSGMHSWLADRLLRAHVAAGRPDLADAATAEHRRSTAALDTFERDWRHGASPVLRGLTDSRVVELLGGPATHPFAPLLPGRVRRFLLEGGLRDTARRLGTRPTGIWAPECGYAPGMEHDYATAGVERFLVDGPAMHGDTAAARPVDGTDVIAFGRDLDVTYRVWSPRSGYPGGPDYRDFHTVDAGTGLKPARVTGRRVARKAPYDAARAAAAVARDADDFVTVVRSRLRDLGARDGRPGLVVAAFDTELFGHWWHEGPAWLERVLTALPEAGVRVTTLRGAVEAGHVGEPAVLPASSWGSGKDWRVWAAGPVADLVADNADVATRLLAATDGADPRCGRDATLDTVAVQAALALSSDWAFMVTKDSAAHYARRRAAVHRDRVRELTDLLPAGRHAEAAARAASFRGQDDLFGDLDVRWLRTAPARERILAGSR